MRVRVSGTAVDDVQPGLTYLHTDHLGSIRALSDEDGAQAGTDIHYEPFGAFRSGAATLAGVTDRAYTGHRSNNLPDDDLGLIYMNARFYLPGTGRFASADTIVPDPADPQSFNRYSYVRNNSLRYRDPSGHAAECSVIRGDCAGGDWSPHEINSASVPQTVNAIVNNSLALPSVVLSEVSYYRPIQKPFVYSTDYLNTVRYAPARALMRRYPYRAVTSGLGYGLPLVGGAVNSVEIQQRAAAGVITSQEQWMEQGVNLTITAGSSYAGGAFLPTAGSAAYAVMGGSVSPALLVAGSTSAFTYNVAVFQGTVNNMIEGKSFGDAFWNARATTNDAYFFWSSSQEVDAWMGQRFTPINAAVADTFIWILRQ